MTKIITFTNYKGGVGKTTLSTLSSIALSLEYKVLLIDLDHQLSATNLILHRFDKKYEKVEKSIFRIFKGKKFKDNIIEINDNLHLIPGDSSLIDVKSRTQLYKNIIDSVDGVYDFVIIDTRPEISVLNDNAFIMSDIIVIVSNCDNMSYDGCKSVITRVKEVEKEFDTKIKIVSMVNKYQKSQLHKDLYTKHVELFGKGNCIPINNSNRIYRYSVEGLPIDKKDYFDNDVLNKIFVNMKKLGGVYNG